VSCCATTTSEGYVLDRLEERVGNPGVPGLGRVQAVNPDEAVDVRPQRGVGVDDRDTLPGSNGAQAAVEVVDVELRDGLAGPTSPRRQDRGEIHAHAAQARFGDHLLQLGGGTAGGAIRAAGDVVMAVQDHHDFRPFGIQRRQESTACGDDSLARYAEVCHRERLR
jgi:hypothetical protein